MFRITQWVDIRKFGLVDRDEVRMTLEIKAFCFSRRWAIALIRQVPKKEQG